MIKYTKLTVSKDKKRPHVLKVHYEGTDDDTPLGRMKCSGLLTEVFKLHGGFVNMAWREPTHIFKDESALLDHLRTYGAPIDVAP